MRWHRWVHLVSVTANEVKNADYDSVIVATGSRPKMFSLGQDEKVYSAEQVLLGQKDVGNEVVVVGTGLVGCELALDLAMKGKKVTIVEAFDKIMAVNGPLCSANKDMLEALIPYHHIAVECNARVKKFEDGKEEEKVISTDSVVLCVGYASENSLYDELKYDVSNLYKIGDAEKVSNIMYAIWDAFEVANHIE